MQPVVSKVPSSVGHARPPLAACVVAAYTRERVPFPQDAVQGPHAPYAPTQLTIWNVRNRGDNRTYKNEPGHAGRFGHAVVSIKPLVCGHATPFATAAVLTEYTRVRVPDPHTAEQAL
jgi:hypothetical protein